MASSLSVKLVYNNLPRLTEQIRVRASEVVAKTAFDLEARAKMNAHVLTGAMRASVYTAVAGGSSDYGQNTSDAQQRNPRALILDQAAPDGELSAVVGVAVNYAAFEEQRAGHAFLLPAAEAVRPSFEAAMAEIAS